MITKLHYISVLKTVPVILVRDLTRVASMVRTIDGRLLPTFLAASPIEEKEPTLEELMRNLAKTQQSLEHNLQWFGDSLLRSKKGRLGMFTKKASKGLYADCGLEFNKSTIIDQPTIDHEERKDPLSGRCPKEDEIIFTRSLVI